MTRLKLQNNMSWPCHGGYVLIQAVAAVCGKPLMLMELPDSINLSQEANTFDHTGKKKMLRNGFGNTKKPV